MDTPIDLRTLGPDEHAAVYDAARREAAQFRRAAIDDAFAALWRAVVSAFGRSRSPAGPRRSSLRTAAPLSA
jgi:hypothetical protein